MKKHTLLALVAIASLACVAFVAPQALPLVAIAAIGLGLVALTERSAPLVPVSNTIEAMMLIPPQGPTLTRSAEATLTKYGVVTEGTAAGQVNVCGASGIPIGVAYIEGSDEAIAADDLVTVHRFASGEPCWVIANEVITRGEAVFTAASGKVQDLPGSAGTYYQIGYALTASAADGDLIQLNPHAPIKTVVS